MRYNGVERVYPSRSSAQVIMSRADVTVPKCDITAWSEYIPLGLVSGDNVT